MKSFLKIHWVTMSTVLMSNIIEHRLTYRSLRTPVLSCVIVRLKFGWWNFGEDIHKCVFFHKFFNNMVYTCSFFPVLNCLYEVDTLMWKLFWAFDYWMSFLSLVFCLWLYFVQKMYSPSVVNQLKTNLNKNDTFLVFYVRLIRLVP